MDLRAYYKKIRGIEATLTGDFVWVASVVTDEGGVEGIMTQVPRHVAARLVVDHKARIASAEEVEQHEAKQAAAVKKIRDEAAASRLQVAIISESQLAMVRGGESGKKEKKD